MDEDPLAFLTGYAPRTLAELLRRQGVLVAGTVLARMPGALVAKVFGEMDDTFRSETVQAIRLARNAPPAFIGSLAETLKADLAASPPPSTSTSAPTPPSTLPASEAKAIYQTPPSTPPPPTTTTPTRTSSSSAPGVPRGVLVRPTPIRPPDRPVADDAAMGGPVKWVPRAVDTPPANVADRAPSPSTSPVAPEPPAPRRPTPVPVPPSGHARTAPPQLIGPRDALRPRSTPVGRPPLANDAVDVSFSAASAAPPARPATGRAEPAPPAFPEVTARTPSTRSPSAAEPVAPLRSARAPERRPATPPAAPPVRPGPPAGPPLTEVLTPERRAALLGRGAASGARPPASGANVAGPAAPIGVGTRPTDFGMSVLATILREADVSVRSRLAEGDPALFASLKRRMFIFGDFVRTDLAALAKIFGGAPSDDVALALRFAAPELRDRVLTALGNRRARVLTETMDRQRDRVSMDDVEAAQQRVLEVGLRLQRAGAVLIDPDDPDLIG